MATALILAKRHQQAYWNNDVPTAAGILKLKNISQTQAPPVPGFELEPLPPEIVRAFPAMEAWRKKQNMRFAKYTVEMNTRSQFTPS